MDLKNEYIEKVYNEFENEKIISNIIDTGLELKYMNTYIWVAPLCIFIGLISSLPFFLILTGIDKIIMISLIIIFFMYNNLPALPVVSKDLAL